MDQNTPQTQAPSGQVVDVSYDEQPNQVTQPSPKKKHGKIVALLLLVLLLIVGAAMGGWWYGTNQAQKESDQKAADLNAKISKLQKELDDQKKQSKEADSKKLVITQWNVKLTPTKSSMTYKIEKLDNGTEVARLTNKDVQALEKDSTCQGEDGLYLATISREKSKTTDGETLGAEFVATIGDYSYYVTGSQGTCTENPSEITYRSQLIEAAKTLEAK